MELVWAGSKEILFFNALERAFARLQVPQISGVFLIQKKWAFCFLLFCELGTFRMCQHNENHYFHVCVGHDSEGGGQPPVPLHPLCVCVFQIQSLAMFHQLCSLLYLTWGHCNIS